MNSMSPPEQIDLSLEPSFQLGAAEVRPATREVMANGTREVLEPRVMQVLVALARRRDRVVSRDELTTCCWAGRVVGEDAINRCIVRIRRLAETHGGFRLETIPRVGYRLLETAVTAPEEAVHLENRPVTIAQWCRRHRWTLAMVAALLLLAAAGGFWLLRPAGEPSPAKFSIAVLPLTPPPGDREAEQLADEVSTRIADMLVSEGIDVVSPAKSRLFRGASKADAAQALHANFVVDGEIRREGGRITAAVRFIDGVGGTTLIAGSVDTANPADLPEAVATRVLGGGWGWLLNFNASAISDLHVMADLLRAVQHLSNPSETVYTYDFAKQFAAAKPDNAFANFFYAYTAELIVPGRAPEGRLPVVLEARAAAHKALQLDPGAADAYATLAAVTPAFNWTIRERYLRQGLRLSPAAPLVYMDLIALRMNAGYLRIGGRMAEDAYSNHPHFDVTIFEAVNARLWLGDPQAARMLAAHAAMLFPKRVRFPAKVFEATAFYGALDEAAAFLKNPAAAPLLQPQGEGKTYGAIVAALRHGRAADVGAVVNDCMKVSGRSHELRRMCFMALVKLGRLDDAFHMADLLYPDQRGGTQAEIEQKWLAQMPFNTVYLVIPATAPLRADPRYRDLAERVGLLQFWRERGLAPDFCAVENAPVCALLKTP